MAQPSIESLVLELYRSLNNQCNRSPSCNGLLCKKGMTGAKCKCFQGLLQTCLEWQFSFLKTSDDCSIKHCNKNCSAYGHYNSLATLNIACLGEVTYKLGTLFPI